MEIRRVRYTDPDVQALVEEVQAEYVVRYGSRDDNPVEAAGFDPPRGAFFVGAVDEVPVTMGGWSFRPDVPRLGGVRAAEIRRMYVAASARRRGLARAMLGHLERTAHAAGADVMVLETGTAQPEAIELYTSAGYRLVESFGHYAASPKSRCLAKRLPG
ncbi:MAG: hypothetical protein AVDCRST_MAG72-1607 [uncultured Nocardioidaceae bacterium]|uniref:N-acetyltransferase domain-containing protein n=1 Tax=uncultured Nocardioidaceae bacterium TaxID=253824 RepID=A0A6J4MBN8_9ACTN|nr:MAG: hypothetical protein AVDCRST_MAG72-1607 [uncultured Nocardioidaceae bacterium]